MLQSLSFAVVATFFTLVVAFALAAQPGDSQFRGPAAQKKIHARR